LAYSPPRRVWHSPGPGALYLPRAWTNAPARRAEAGVPEELVFRNKEVELAEGMLERAFEAGGPARWVLADSF
jgi:SRSO17 transposase